MSDRVELKHLEMENQKYQFRYLRNQLNEKKLYRGDPRLLMYVYFHDGRKQAEIAKGLCVKPAEPYCHAPADGAGRSCEQEK